MGYPIINGIPDFVTVAEPKLDNPNQIWSEPATAAARNVYYTLNHRELRGMECCIEYITRKAFPGCHILDVGMGTGHFTRWIAEACPAGTEIYALDISQPMLEIARANIDPHPGVTLFRADSRKVLPFGAECFDIVFNRQAPLGEQAVANVLAAYPLLKTGGWYYEAGWETSPYDSGWVEIAENHGYGCAAILEWDYARAAAPAELDALRIERDRVSIAIQKPLPNLDDRITQDGEVRYLHLHEHLKIACKDTLIYLNFAQISDMLPPK